MNELIDNLIAEHIAQRFVPKKHYWDYDYLKGMTFYAIVNDLDYTDLRQSGRDYSDLGQMFEQEFDKKVKSQSSNGCESFNRGGVLER